MAQFTFTDLAHQKKYLRCQKFLSEMDKIIPWKRLCRKIEPRYYSNATGRPSMPLERMVRIYFLQQWYQLSDPAMEDAIHDRYSFQQFLKLNLMKDTVPDETTILNFRHLLEDHNLTEKLFRTVNRFLEEKGLMMKKGTIVDATLISSPSSTKNASGKRDPEMTATRKNNQYHFGMKAHIGVDSKSGLVHSLKATTAKINDRCCFSELLHGKEQVVLGDKGYWSDQDKKLFRKRGIVWGIAEKRKPCRGPLSLKQLKHNKQYGRVRWKVEHSFQVIKCQWGYVKTRYRGIKKNAAQLFSLFMLQNLYKVRKSPLLAVP